MEKKVKKSDINLLIMLVGILLAVIAYFVIYQNFTEKRDAIAAENAALEVEVGELQKLADNKEFYLAETDRMNTEMNDIMANYPGEVRNEEMILYAAGLETTNSIWVNSIVMEPSAMVQTAQAAQPAAQPADATQDATQDAAAVSGEATPVATGLKETVFLYASPYELGFKTTYRSIKDIINAVVTNDERMNISSLSLAYDNETGCLAGSLAMNIYTMSGTGKLYENVDVPGVATGTNDFFQSGTVLNIDTVQNFSGDVEGGTEDGEEQEDSETDNSDEEE